MTLGRIVIALAVMALAFAIFFSAATLINHNALLNCNNKLISQALNEAFHHKPIKIAVCS